MNQLRQYASGLAGGFLLFIAVIVTLAATGILAPTKAHAAYVSSFRSYAPVRVYVAPRPVYIAPRPVIIARPVVPIYTPRPVIVARPPVVVVAPHPIYSAAAAYGYAQPAAVVHSGGYGYGYSSGTVFLYVFLLLLVIVVLGSGIWFWNPLGYWAPMPYFGLGGCYGYDVVDYGVDVVVYE
jgi:hypothetical protein